VQNLPREVGFAVQRTGDPVFDGVPHILIADDDADVRSILADFLTHRGCEVREARDGEVAFALAQTQPADIALLDVVMPGLSGIELIPHLQSLWPGCVVILLTAYGTVPQAVEAIRQGAFDYLEKPVELKQIQAVVERAWKMKRARVQALETLTKREREVLSLLAHGKTDAEIAEALRLSAHTVNSHTRKIFAKLNVNKRTEAVTVWLRSTGK
jgi:DNA-binding NarL/FixJ family response regulator